MPVVPPALNGEVLAIKQLGIGGNPTTLQWAPNGGGTNGDVSGPGGVTTQGEVPIWNNATGKLLGTTGVTINAANNNIVTAGSVTATSMLTPTLHITGGGGADVAFDVPAGVTDTYTWPATTPTVGQILSSDATGQFSWIDNGGGDVSGVAPSVVSEVAIWDDTTGTKIRSASGVTITGSAVLSAQHVIVADVRLKAGTSSWNLAAPATLAATEILTFPTNGPAAGQILQSDATGQLSWVTNGDVSGPVASTDTAVAIWDGVGGDKLANSTVLINSLGLLTAPIVKTNTVQLMGGATGNLWSLQASGTLAADVTLTWPAAAPTAGQTLSSSATGQMSWVTNGAGDVVGPASATNNALVRWDTTTGELVQNSIGILTDAGDMSGLASVTTGTLSATISATTPKVILTGVANNTTLDTAATADYTLTFPAAAPTDGTSLRSDGSGNFSWVALMEGWKLAGDGGSNLQDIENGAEVTIAGGDNITTVTSAPETLTVDLDPALTGLTSVEFKNGANNTTLDTAATADYTLTFPTGAPPDKDQILVSKASGELEWETRTSGTVIGPGSSTDNALVRWDSTTGKIIQNSTTILDDGGNLTGLSEVTCKFLTLSGTQATTLSPSTGSTQGYTFPAAGPAGGGVLNIMSSSELGIMAWENVTGNLIGGPGASTDTAIATWNGTGGDKLANNTSVTITGAGAAAVLDAPTVKADTFTWDDGAGKTVEFTTPSAGLDHSFKLRWPAGNASAPAVGQMLVVGSEISAGTDYGLVWRQPAHANLFYNFNTAGGTSTPNESTPNVSVPTGGPASDWTPLNLIANFGTYQQAQARVTGGNLAQDFSVFVNPTADAFGPSCKYQGSATRTFQITFSFSGEAVNQTSNDDTWDFAICAGDTVLNNTQAVAKLQPQLEARGDFRIASAFPRTSCISGIVELEQQDTVIAVCRNRGPNTVDLIMYQCSLAVHSLD